MPYVHITVATPVRLSRGNIAALQTETLHLMKQILRKEPSLTAIRLDEIGLRSWWIGGKPAPAAAHLEANITAGTNTVDEKERFIAEAADLFRRVIGPDLPIATYVIIREVPADAWGYNGQSQDYRRRSKAMSVGLPNLTPAPSPHP